ncbi:MAG TPA: DUF3011 domain-containing protein [Thermoanaerobaculia bacterium]|nr:DUF3011 domain-containing protein [Thermoanaerobaculia bacterium]
MRTAFLTLIVLAFTAVPAVAQSTVLCESTDGKYRECRLEGVGVATLTRQLSDNTCIEGQTWGYRDGRIWVDRGCRAQFALTSRVASAPLDTRITCESMDGRLSRCLADTAAGVQLVRRISDSGCEFGRDWGYDRDGIWVSNGCRAEFAVTTSRFAAAPIAGTTHILCESQDGRRTNCRADTRYGVELRRQISDANCVRNTTWGVDTNGIWVSGGCRAEFTVGSDRYAVATTLPLPARSANMLICESIDGRRSHCRADTDHGAVLTRQISDTACRYGRTWGIDENGVWVDNGCRAEFALGDPSLIRGGMISSAPAIAPTLVCESENNGHKHCRADTRFGVTLLRRLSDAKCERDRTWGVDDVGVWVTNGCRAEFVLERR